MSRRTTNFDRPLPNISVGVAFIYGCVAGVVGVGGMTLSEKTEQSLTHRANSRVPGKTLARLLNLPPGHLPNLTMHYGQGALVGGIRGVMALYGVRGPFADFMLMALRLSVDQTLENVTGVGTPPWTWPVWEQVVDLLHKAVYAGVTGWVCDAWIQ